MAAISSRIPFDQAIQRNPAHLASPPPGRIRSCLLSFSAMFRQLSFPVLAFWAFVPGGKGRFRWDRLRLVEFGSAHHRRVEERRHLEGIIWRWFGCLDKPLWLDLIL
jgi:hypothetical protein